MDDVFWGILCAIALLGLFALLVCGIVFAAIAHAWGLLALVAGLLAGLLALLLAFMLCTGREPRERRVVQKGARWP